MDTDEFIAATMRRVAASAGPPPRDSHAPASTRWWLAPVGVAAAVGVVALVVAAASVVGSHRSEVRPAVDATSTTSTACRLNYTPEPLPPWARSGFTPPTQAIPFVLGDRGDMAAIVWDTHHPLVAPPAVDKNNKILWVARVGEGEGPLRIRATLAGTGQTVTRTVATAPGPSTVDLPAAGCWSLDLEWGSHRDHLVLGYAAG